MARWLCEQDILFAVRDEEVTCSISLQKLFSVENSPPPPRVYGTVGIMIVLGLQALGVFFQGSSYSRVVFPGGGMDTFSSIDQVKDFGFSSAENLYVLVNLERIFVCLKTKKAWAKPDLLSLRHPKQGLQGKQKDSFPLNALHYWSSIPHCTLTVSLHFYVFSQR